MVWQNLQTEAVLAEVLQQMIVWFVPYITCGKDADLVIFDEDISIKQVLITGKTTYYDNSSQGGNYGNSYYAKCSRSWAVGR